MDTVEQSTEYGSFAQFFGANSMEAWSRVLLDDRCCMNCGDEIDGLEGAMIFRGWNLQVDLVGHLCESCRKQPEAVRYYRRFFTIR
jgi:hypothetical protein